jgi:hypothetical protein
VQLIKHQNNNQRVCVNVILAQISTHVIRKERFILYWNTHTLPIRCSRLVCMLLESVVNMLTDLFVCVWGGGGLWWGEYYMYLKGRPLTTRFGRNTCSGVGMFKEQSKFWALSTVLSSISNTTIRRLHSVSVFRWILLS